MRPVLGNNTHWCIPLTSNHFYTELFLEKQGRNAIQIQRVSTFRSFTSLHPTCQCERSQCLSPFRSDPGCYIKCPTCRFKRKYCCWRDGGHGATIYTLTQRNRL